MFGANEILKHGRRPPIIILPVRDLCYDRKMMWFYQSLAQISYTSVILGINQFSLVNMICFTCLSGFGTLVKITNFKFLDVYGTLLNRVLRGARVETLVNYLEPKLKQYGSTNCNIYKQKEKVDIWRFESICLYHRYNWPHNEL